MEKNMENEARTAGVSGDMQDSGAISLMGIIQRNGKET